MTGAGLGFGFGLGVCQGKGVRSRNGIVFGFGVGDGVGVGRGVGLGEISGDWFGEAVRAAKKTLSDNSHVGDTGDDNDSWRRWSLARRMFPHG